MTAYNYRWSKADNINDAVTAIEDGAEAVGYKCYNATTEDAIKVASALEKSRTCRALDFCENNAGPDGFKAICRAVETPYNMLTVICIHSNGIGAEGAEYLAGAMKSPHCMLSELYLGNNNMLDRGVTALADALKVNHYVRAMYLARNRMTDIGAKACLEALEYNKSIVILQLKQNYRRWSGLNEVSSEITLAVEQKLKRNKDLQRNKLKELVSKNGAPWMRSKLMVIGQGRAGKTATIRSLLRQPYKDDLESTIGASLSQTKAHVGGGGWTNMEDDSKDFFAAFARRFVTTSFLEEMNPKRTSTFLKSQAENVEENEHSREQGVTEDKEIVDEENEKMTQLFGSQELVYDKSDNYHLSFSIWDYGGQRVFYTLHHLFLTKFGVYLLVFDLREILTNETEAIDNISFWINSVTLHAPGAPVLMVGSHFDFINKSDALTKVNKLLGKILTGKLEQVVKNSVNEFELPMQFPLYFFPINNKTGEGSDIIRNRIEEAAREQEYVQQHVSLNWVSFIDTLLKDKDQKWLKLHKAHRIANESGISDENEVETMLGFFHELGSIVHFTSTEALRDIITISPQWLVDSISKVIRDDKLHRFDENEIELFQLKDDVELLFNNGLATRDLLEFLWDNNQANFMLDLMKHALLLSDWKFAVRATDEEVYLVPSMLKDIPGEYAQYQSHHRLIYDFANTFLPYGVFERVVCLCIAHSAQNKNSREPLLSRKTAVIWMEPETCMLLKSEPNRITVHFNNLNTLSIAVRMINSMMYKGEISSGIDEFTVDISLVRTEIMNGRLRWQALLTNEREGEVIEFDKAKKEKLEPWFADFEPLNKAVLGVSTINIRALDDF